MAHVGDVDGENAGGERGRLTACLSFYVSYVLNIIIPVDIWDSCHGVTTDHNDHRSSSILTWSDCFYVDMCFLSLLKVVTVLTLYYAVPDSATLSTPQRTGCPVQNSIGMICEAVMFC